MLSTSQSTSWSNAATHLTAPPKTLTIASRYHEPEPGGEHGSFYEAVLREQRAYPLRDHMAHATAPSRGAFLQFARDVIDVNGSSVIRQSRRGSRVVVNGFCVVKWFFQHRHISVSLAKTITPENTGPGCRQHSLCNILAVQVNSRHIRQPTKSA